MAMTDLYEQFAKMKNKWGGANNPARPQATPQGDNVASLADYQAKMRARQVKQAQGQAQTQVQTPQGDYTSRMSAMLKGVTNPDDINALGKYANAISEDNGQGAKAVANTQQTQQPAFALGKTNLMGTAAKTQAQIDTEKAQYADRNAMALEAEKNAALLRDKTVAPVTPVAPTTPAPTAPVAPKPVASAYEQAQSKTNAFLDKMSNLVLNGNPFESAAAKAIMASFGIKGYGAGQNELAGGAAGNSGNIDSYSAANANRQQAAFTGRGIDAVIANNQNTINSGMNLADRYGINSQNIFTNDQTAKTGDVNRASTSALTDQTKATTTEIAPNAANARDVNTMNVTGTQTDSVLMANNPYFKGGKLIDTTTDFKAIIDDPNSTPEQKAWATQARNVKTDGLDASSPYAGQKLSYAPVQTLAAKALAEQTKLGYSTIASNEKIAEGANATSIYIADQNNITTRYQIDEQGKLAKYQIDEDGKLTKYQVDVDSKNKQDQTALGYYSAKQQAGVGYAQVAASRENNAASNALGYAQIAADISANAGKSTDAQDKDFYNRADTQIKNINDTFKSNTYTKADGANVIEINGNGNYTWASGIDTNAFTEPVIASIAKNGNLNMDEKQEMYTALGIPKTAVDKVMGYLK